MVPTSIQEYGFSLFVFEIGFLPAWFFIVQLLAVLLLLPVEC